MDGIQWLSIFGGINWWSSLVPLNLPPIYIYYLDQVQGRANRGQGRYRSNTQLTVFGCVYSACFMGGCIIYRFVN